MIDISMCSVGSELKQNKIQSTAASTLFS